VQLNAAERDYGPLPSLTPPAADPVGSSENTTVRKPLVPRQPAPEAEATPVQPPGVRHESRDHAWARLLTSAAIVGAIATWFFSLPPTGEHARSAQTEKPADPSARFVAAGASALAAYRLDHFDQAQIEYIKALAFHEHDAQILSAISRVHALWAEELRSQRELSKLAPDQAPSSALEAQAIEAQMHAQRAKHYAELALQGISGNSEALLAESDALRLLGDLPGARAALERALAQQPTSAEGFRIAALLDPSAAVELATRAVSGDPTQLATRFLLARTLFVRGDAEGVRAQLQAITAQAPTHPEAARLEALLVAREAPAQQAVADAQSARPSEAESFIERGRSMLEAGQTAGAKRMFDHALTLQPDCVPAHAGLGQVAIARGRPVQAVDHLVAAALGGDGESLIALAELYRRLGRQREALAAYQSYLQQNPHGPQLDLAKSQIERLGEQFASARKP
jgi:tetratricopeptide (TPR) repeat protein